MRPLKNAIRSTRHLTSLGSLASFARSLAVHAVRHCCHSTAMITPMRFGLKYAPVPTLALEYEDDLAGVDDDGGGTSLYIYSSDRHASQQRMKKLHVVELPALTRQSEAVAVARQLQQDNRRFLAPDVVKEDQLVRLLERLMAHLQATELTVSSMTTTSAAAVTSVVTTAAAVSGVFGTHHHDPSDAQDAHDESELEASAMSESIAETSASLADSHVDDLKHGVDAGSQARTKAAAVRPSADSDGGDDDRDPDTEAVTAAAVRAPAAASDAHDDTYGDDVDEATERKREADADTVRRAALQRDDTASEAASDEDIQSEELEYFSEDESDEDSF